MIKIFRRILKKRKHEDASEFLDGCKIDSFKEGIQKDRIEQELETLALLIADIYSDLMKK